MYIKPFSALRKEDTQLAGGKGASLGEMTAAAIPVPPGFVILSTAFEQFIKETGIAADIVAVLEKINYRDITAVERASKEIKAMILGKELSSDLAESILSNFQKLNCTYVAVRSSATAEDSASAAWAGQLDTFLNTTENKLLQNVRSCWASLFTPRAIFYRFEKELHEHKISVAVVVQQMIESEKSGIAFSVHPVTQDHNCLIIEGGFGLGEAIVSGQVTPDSYIVEKDSRQIVETHVSEQSKKLVRGSEDNEWIELGAAGAVQKLTNEQVLALAELIIMIEDHYGFPVDVEWAYVNGKFFITQSRPITTLNVDANNSIVRILESKKKEILPLLFTREFPIILCEVWGKRYKLFFGTEVKTTPRQIFVLQNGFVKTYRKQEITKEINGIFFELFASRPNGIQDLHDRFLKEFKEIEVVWSKPYLSKNELLLFTEQLMEFWVAIYAGMYIARDERFSQEEKNLMLAVRKQIDVAADEATHIIVASLKYLYPHFGNLIMYMTIDDLRHGVSEDVLLERSKKVLYMIDGDIVDEATFSLLQEQHHFELEQEVITDMEELSGDVACSGKAQGIVRILMRRADIQSFKEGEILVSSMTVPDFLPAMQKAAAFVTDEGGITCHAAIIARELKKPCIINTKHATALLKNGDEVEVDANRGIVRIL